MPLNNPNRLEVNNLIANGDFEYAPSFTAATTASGVWVDGTTSGSSSSIYNVGVVHYVTGCSAQFDSSVKHSGSYSMKLSTTNTLARGALVIGNTNTGSTRLPNTFSVRPIIVAPSATYKLSYWMKTNNAATDSAFMVWDAHNGSGTRISANNISTTKLSGTNDWTYIEDTITTPASSYYLNITFRLNVAGNVSDLWVDDITLTKTTNETRTAVV